MYREENTAHHDGGKRGVYGLPRALVIFTGYEDIERPMVPLGWFRTCNVSEWKSRTSNISNIFCNSALHCEGHTTVEPEWCSGRKLAPEALSDALDLMQRTVLVLLVKIAGGLDWIDEPFQTLDCTVDGFAQGIPSFPLGHGFQHVAHSGTTLGQLYECIVFYQLVLNVPLRGVQGRKRKRARTLTRPKMPTTDSNATLKGTSPRLLMAVVRVSMSAFNAALVVDPVPTLVSMFSAAQGSRLSKGGMRDGEWGGRGRTVGIAGHEDFTWPGYFG